MLDVAYFSALFLVFLRVITFFVALSVLFPQGLPNSIKVFFSLILAFFIMSTINYSNLNINNNILIYAEYCACEIVTGLILGYLTNLAFLCSEVAGNLLDLQIGLSMMTMFDPATQSNSSLIQRLLNFLTIIIFLIINGHLILIKALTDSFSTVHLGQFVFVQGSAMLALNAFIQFFIIGVRIALPIVLVLMMTDIVLGLVSRTVPQLNVMILGLPLKILLGFTIFMMLLTSIANSIIDNFNLIPQLWSGFYHTLPLPLLFVFASEEKTEEATPKKKGEAKKKGQTARSKDIGLALSLMVVTLVFAIFGDYCLSILENMFNIFFSGYMNKTLTEGDIQNILIFAIKNIGIIVLIIAVPVMVVGIAGSIFQTGFIFSTEGLKPDFGKLNPINGFKKMFSSRTLVELLKSLALVSIIGYIGYNFIMSNLGNILQMNTLNFSYIPSSFKGLLVSIFFQICIALIVISIVDYLYQRFMFNKDLKMTKQEVKEEYKQDEGDPTIKSKRRRQMKEMSARRMMASVPTATVVVANPTHFAVALSYVEGKSSAPIVVAKGADRIALKIKEVAKENDVPVIENKSLARLLYAEVEIDKEIPMDMYQAVAEILAIVYKMKKR
jgi:flagellar biosynthetic protein FliR/FlhB